MNIRIAIFDEDKVSLSELKEKVLEISNQLNFKAEIYDYNNADKIINVVKQVEEVFDILFLDISDSTLSGLYIANIIRRFNPNILIIFMSLYDEYVFESIEYNPFRYIRKNKVSEELPSAIKAAIRKFEQNKDTSIILRSDNEEYRIYYSDIMYVETAGRKLNIYLYNGKTISIWKTIKEFTEQINDNNFIKVHSGCLVNRKYISTLSNFHIILNNGSKIEISRRGKKVLKEELLKYYPKI